MRHRQTVLLVSGEYPPMQGGVADFTRLVGQAMTDLGRSVHVLTSRQVAGREPSSGARCHPLVTSWSWSGLYGSMRRVCAQVEPGVINIQYQAAAYGMHPAINLLPFFFPHIPMVVTFHDLLVPYLFPKAGPVRWWANLALARFARAVIVTNAQDEAQLATCSWLVPWGMPHGTPMAAHREGRRQRTQYLSRVPIGSNIDYELPTDYSREAWRARWGLGQDTLALCYFGFLNRSKGGEELIHALDALLHGGHDARLLMIGGATGASDPTNEAYLQVVRQLIEEKELQMRVIWTGYMPPMEVSATLKAADICVLPYRDGASFRRGSFMAALAHGMPIVTTVPAVELPELKHGENVLLVPPRDVPALSQAIVRLAHAPDLRERLSLGALALSQQFDWRNIAARTLEVLDAVAAP